MKQTKRQKLPQMVLCTCDLSFVCAELNFYCKCNKSFMLAKFLPLIFFRLWLFVGKLLSFLLYHGVLKDTSHIFISNLLVQVSDIFLSPSKMHAAEYICHDIRKRRICSFAHLDTRTSGRKKYKKTNTSSAFVEKEKIDFGRVKP